MVQALAGKDRPHGFLDKPFDLQYFDAGRGQHLLRIAPDAAHQQGAAIRQAICQGLPALLAAARTESQGQLVTAILPDVGERYFDHQAYRTDS